jgi:hypothetical protein
MLVRPAYLAMVELVVKKPITHGFGCIGMAAEMQVNALTH